MKLYLKYLNLHLRRQLQHRLSFVFVSFGQACFAATSLISIMFLMPKGTSVMGFNQNEVLLAGAIINLSYSSAECFGRGFDTFGSLIKRGDFDRIIVRPLSEIAQIFMVTLDFTRIGRFLVALITLLFTLSTLPPIPVFYLILMVLAGTLVYICLFIIYGSICFYTTENLEVFNILTDGTKEFGKAPYSFYGESVLKVLTYIIPLALVQYYPLLYILGKSSNLIHLFSPILSLLFIFPTLIIWKTSRRKYRSTGS